MDKQSMENKEVLGHQAEARLVQAAHNRSIMVKESKDSSQSGRDSMLQMETKKKFVKHEFEDTTPQAKFTVGKHTAFSPSSASNSDLMVFFPGTSSYCSFYNAMLFTAGSGMNVLCMAYDQSYDSEYWTFGGFEGRAFMASKSLAAALQYLSEQEAFSSWADDYLDEEGEPQWSKIRASGHSQGSVIAAEWATQYSLSRYIAFAGPGKQFYQELEWIQEGVQNTSDDRMFAIESVQDYLLHWLPYTQEMYKSQELPGDDWTVGQRGTKENLRRMGATRIQEVSLEDKDCCKSDTQIVLLNITATSDIGMGHNDGSMGPDPQLHYGKQSLNRVAMWKHVIGI